MEQRLAGPPGGGGSAGARCRFSGRPRSLPVAWRPRHYQSGGHGIRTHNRFPGTTFPVWPLTIRLPSKRMFFRLSPPLSPQKTWLGQRAVEGEIRCWIVGVYLSAAAGACPHRPPIFPVFPARRRQPRRFADSTGEGLAPRKQLANGVQGMVGGQRGDRPAQRPGSLFSPRRRRALESGQLVTEIVRVGPCFTRAPAFFAWVPSWVPR